MVPYENNLSEGQETSETSREIRDAKRNEE